MSVATEMLFLRDAVSNQQSAAAADLLTVVWATDLSKAVSLSVVRVVELDDKSILLIN